LTNSGWSKAFFYLIDRLTDYSPEVFPKRFEKVFLSLLGSDAVFHWYMDSYRNKARRAKSFERILVIIDVGIGDAIMMQQSVTTLRQLFPASRIEYVCSKIGGELLDSLPGVDRVFKVFAGGGAPSQNDLLRVGEIVRGNEYDLIINLSPFTVTKTLGSKAQNVDLFVPLSAYLIHQSRVTGAPPHVSAGVHWFLIDFFEPISGVTPASVDSFHGNEIFLRAEDAAFVQEFLMERSAVRKDRLVFFHLDGSSPFTQVPIDGAIQLIARILNSCEKVSILVGTQKYAAEIEREVGASVPLELRERVVVIPLLPPPVYAALIDACDLFISGDGGPLHIAAARKIIPGGRPAMRNCTTIVTIFGATPPRMYGYDSNQPGFLAANQDAPSKVFAGNPPCRNITCINKWGKTCREIRCFRGFDPRAVADYAVSDLNRRQLEGVAVPSL
jgi:heptosyltransferase-2/heptosyltransferase-3